jgi:hypothetical protein
VCRGDRQSGGGGDGLPVPITVATATVVAELAADYPTYSKIMRG